MKLNKLFSAGIFILFLFLSFSITQAQSLETLIQKGDSLYYKFQNEKALTVFQQADKLYPAKWEVLYRLSRTYVDIGEHMPANTSEQEDAQLATYEKAELFADSAVALAPNKSINYLRRSIAKGRIALFKGVFSGGVSYANQVKEDVEKAIELNNGNKLDMAVAHYVLARSHMKVSEKWAPARAVLGLGWADNEIAIEEYKKALKLDPEFMMIYLDYARSLINEDEYETAREMLNKAIACPIRDEDDPQRIKEAKALLIEIEDE